MASGGDGKKSRFSLSGFGGSSKTKSDGGANATAASSAAAELEKQALQDQLDQQTAKAAALKEAMQGAMARTKELEEEIATLRSQAAASAPLDLLSDSVAVPLKNERVSQLESQCASLNEQLTNVKEVLAEKETAQRAYEDEKAALLSDTKKAKAESARYKSEAEKARAESASLRTEVESAKKEIDKLKSVAAAAPSATAVAPASSGTVDLLSLSAFDPPSMTSAPSVSSSASSERVSELEKLNDLMMDKVRKKDETVNALRDQTEKLNQKIAQLEADSKLVKEKSAEIDRLNKQIKEKDAQISKARSGGDDSAKSKVLTAELTKSNERIGALERERESIKAEKNALQDQINDKERIIEAKQLLITDLTATTSLQEKKLVDLCDKLEKLSVDFKKSLDEIERKYEVDVDALKNKDVSERSSWIEQRANFEQAIRDLTERTRAKDETIAELEGKLELSLQETQHAKGELSSLQSAVSDLNTRVFDLLAQQKVEVKKRKVLLTDLQLELEKSLMSAKAKDIRILELEDENKTLTRRSHQLTLTTESDGAANNHTQSPHHGTSPPHSPEFAPASPHRAHSTPHVASSAVDEEVSAALATKLAAVQDENFTIKRKMRGLEEHVELLEHDVNQKKEMIRNFVRRIETGALTTAEQANDRGSQSAMYASLSHSDRQALFDKMETVLQETTMANIQLKEQVKLMGEEVRKASDRVSAVEADKVRSEEELESIKGSVEELREEKELAEQAKADAEKLVASSHAQLREKDLIIAELRATVSDAANDQGVATQKAREQLEAVKLEREVAMEESSHLKAELAARENDVLVIKNTVNTLRAKLKQIATDNETVTAALTASQSALAAAKSEFARAQQQLAENESAAAERLQSEVATAVAAARGEEVAKSVAAAKAAQEHFDSTMAAVKAAAADALAKTQSDSATAIDAANNKAKEEIDRIKAGTHDETAKPQEQTPSHDESS